MTSRKILVSNKESMYWPFDQSGRVQISSIPTSYEVGMRTDTSRILTQFRNSRLLQPRFVRAREL